MLSALKITVSDKDFSYIGRVELSESDKNLLSRIHDTCANDGDFYTLSETLEVIINEGLQAIKNQLRLS